MRIGLGMSLTRPYASGGAPAPVAAPVITWTSGTAAYNPSFTLTGIALADVVELQIDDVNTFTSLYGSDTNTVDSTEAEDGNLSFPAIPTLGYATTYYARARITRGGQTSAWSNIVSKAMDAEPVVPTIFGDVSDVTRSQYISLDATKKIATSVDTGAYMTVITNNAKRSGTRYFEVSIDPFTTFADVGIGVGASWTANFANPGDSASRIWRSFNGIVRNNSTNVGTEASFDLATPGVIGCKVAANDDVTFYLGATAGTTRNIPGASTWKPFVTLRRADVATLRVTAAEIVNMPSGATGWDD